MQEKFPNALPAGAVYAGDIMCELTMVQQLIRVFDDWFVESHEIDLNKRPFDRDTAKAMWESSERFYSVLFMAVCKLKEVQEELAEEFEEELKHE